jgi:flagellar hook-length control protein FliK
MLSPQTSADTTSTAAAQRPTGTALLTAQQPALPSSLPASLNDVVQASRLYQRVGGAEMHIAMDTDLLGSIDLRAVVHQSGLTATIGVQHADVQALLSSELPGLQHALSQKNLHVEQISIFGSAVGSQSNQGGSQSQQQKQTPAFAPQATAAWPGSANGRDESLASVSDAAVGSGGTGRLSVHA